MKDQDFGCDLLVISPHTDDAEIGLGGTIASLSKKGRRIWVVDLTRGELGSNATSDERWAEAAEASRTLGLAGRLQLNLPDGFINATDRDHLMAVVWALRTFRPRWVVAAPDPRLGEHACAFLRPMPAAAVPDLDAVRNAGAHASQTPPRSAGPAFEPVLIRNMRVVLGLLVSIPRAIWAASRIASANLSLG